MSATLPAWFIELGIVLVAMVMILSVALCLTLFKGGQP